MEPDMDTREVIDAEAAQAWGGASALIDFPVINDAIVGRVPLDRLGRHFNALEQSPWHDGQGVTREGVLKALDEGRLETVPYSLGCTWEEREDWSPRRHEERIAYLVVNPSDQPISIEFNYPDDEEMTVDDGHHRLAAAIIRNDEYVLIQLGGYFSNCVRALGVIVGEYQRLSDHFADERLEA